MSNPVTWAKDELKRLNPKWRGLGLMTLGFLAAVAAAAFAVLSAYLFSALGHSDSSLKTLLVALGWVVMIAGAFVMVVGIIQHWFSMFRVDKGEK